MKHRRNGEGGPSLGQRGKKRRLKKVVTGGKTNKQRVAEDKWVAGREEKGANGGYFVDLQGLTGMWASR